MIIREKITSLDIHLDYPTGTVIQTKCLEDVACGIYPCFYYKNGDEIYASQSVIALICSLGNLDLNKKFRPYDYIISDPINMTLYERIRQFPLRVMDKFSRGIVWQNREYYPKWYTIDNRINRLRSFEKVEPNSQKINFKPDYTIRNTQDIVTAGAYHIQKFMNTIEKKYPDHKHIVSVGGKDSQIMLLTEKINPENWYVFSAEPNYPLVKEWIKNNDIFVKEIFGHPNTFEEENIEVFKAKNICSDLYVGYRHFRWKPAMRRISERFNQKCIFWSGTSGGAIFSHYPPFHYSRKRFFKAHQIRSAFYQGTAHNATKNFLGCSRLSPYHSEEIWRELIQHIDPKIFKRGMDLRPAIGEKLLGRPVKWQDRNPGPKGCSVKYDIDLLETYIQYIQSKLAK